MIPMVLGGKSKTNLAEGRLLCPATQRPVAEYEMKTIPNERVVFSGT